MPSFGVQVEGDRATAPSTKFPHSPQRMSAVGGTGPRQFFGKDFEIANRGSASVHVPSYVTHSTDGLYKSNKHANSPRFRFSQESRF